MGQAASAPPGLQPRILLVEDVADIRDALALALEDLGLAVTAVETAGAAIAELRAGRYLLVITDDGLPDRSGAAMLAEARAHGLLDGADAILLSANPDVVPPADVPLVAKPLDVDEFVARVARTLAARRPPG